MTVSLAERAGSSHHWQAAVASSDGCWKSWSCASPFPPRIPAISPQQHSFRQIRGLPAQVKISIEPLV